MRPLRVAHLSDTHLGYRALAKADPLTGRNQRAVDIERAYEVVVDDILTRDVDLVLHSGDVFHHTRPTWPAMRAFVSQTRRLSDAGLPVLVIGGNHDTPRLRAGGSVFSVLELALQDVHFICEYEQDVRVFPELELAVTAIPHGKLIDPIGPSTMPEPNVRNILVTHGFVSGMTIGKRQHEPGEAEVADFLLGEEFDYIALGHYHVFHPINSKIWYSGSTERMGFGDEDVTPGYALVEFAEPGLPPRVTHIPIEARPMRTLHPVSADGRDAQDLADAILDRVDKANEPSGILRIEVQDAQRSVRREAESIIRRSPGERCWHLQVFARSDVLNAPEGEVDRSGTTDARTLFGEFLTVQAYEPPAFAAAFSSRGQAALDDAIRQLDELAAAGEGLT